MNKSIIFGGLGVILGGVGAGFVTYKVMNKKFEEKIGELLDKNAPIWTDLGDILVLHNENHADHYISQPPIITQEEMVVLTGALNDEKNGGTFAKMGELLDKNGGTLENIDEIGQNIDESNDSNITHGQDSLNQYKQMLSEAEIGAIWTDFDPENPDDVVQLEEKMGELLAKQSSDPPFYSNDEGKVIDYINEFGYNIVTDLSINAQKRVICGQKWSKNGGTFLTFLENLIFGEKRLVENILQNTENGGTFWIFAPFLSTIYEFQLENG